MTLKSSGARLNSLSELLRRKPIVEVWSAGVVQFLNQLFQLLFSIGSCTEVANVPEATRRTQRHDHSQPLLRAACYQRASRDCSHQQFA